MDAEEDHPAVVRVCPTCLEEVEPLPTGACPICDEAPERWSRMLPKRSGGSWWEARRGFYNRGLLIAGPAAFVAGCGVLEVVDDRLGGEVTVFTMAVLGLGYLFMMGVANLCYELGPMGEVFVPAGRREGYRRLAYGWGCAFSFALPLAIPIMVWFAHHDAPPLGPHDG